eukprot:6078909-Ditylum_brightwellii.AAC.1
MDIPTSNPSSACSLASLSFPSDELLEPPPHTSLSKCHTDSAYTDTAPSLYRGCVKNPAQICAGAPVA